MHDVRTKKKRGKLSSSNLSNGRMKEFDRRRANIRTEVQRTASSTRPSIPFPSSSRSSPFPSTTIAAAFAGRRRGRRGSEGRLHHLGEYPDPLHGAADTRLNVAYLAGHSFELQQHIVLSHCPHRHRRVMTELGDLTALRVLHRRRGRQGRVGLLVGQVGKHGWVRVGVQDDQN